MPAVSITGTVLRHLLNHPDTPETVREWLRAEADPERRALYFAVNLAEDYLARFRLAEDAGDPEAALHNRLMRMALDRVNWQRVAEALLRHFSLPMILASRPAKHGAGRIDWTPAAWKGPDAN